MTDSYQNLVNKYPKELADINRERLILVTSIRLKFLTNRTIIGHGIGFLGNIILVVFCILGENVNKQ